MPDPLWAASMTLLLKWYGHVPSSSGPVKTILRGTVKGGRRQGRQKEEVGRQHQGMDRPGVRQVPEGSGEQKDNWRKLVGKSSVVPQQQLRLRDRWLSLLVGALSPVNHKGLCQGWRDRWRGREVHDINCHGCWLHDLHTRANPSPPPFFLTSL